jgi:uncharacterized membrane protein YccF (DUF307 family)
MGLRGLQWADCPADCPATANARMASPVATRKPVLAFGNDIGTGALGTFGNVIWFVFAGIWLAIGHLLSELGCFVTIIGIPFGIQHLKLAGIALAPIGKTIVGNEVAAAARAAAATSTVADIRSPNRNST